MDDAPAIRAIEQSAPSASHWSDGQYGISIQNSIALVAEQAGTVCGFVIAQAVTDEWEIENIAVASGFLRKGVATTLLREVINKARTGQVATIRLEVRESSAPARSLYEKLGFAPRGRRLGYYRNPDEAAILYAIEF